MLARALVLCNSCDVLTVYIEVCSVNHPAPCGALGKSEKLCQSLSVKHWVSVSGENLMTRLTFFLFLSLSIFFYTLHLLHSPSFCVLAEDRTVRIACLADLDKKYTLHRGSLQSLDKDQDKHHLFSAFSLFDERMTQKSTCAGVTLPHKSVLNFGKK